MNKELLLKDLCARLPYRVKCKYYGCCKGDYNEGTICGFERHEYVQIDGVCIYIEEVQPYLFPLLSMTEEQYNSLHELGILDNCSHSYEYVNPHIHGVSFIFKQFKTYSLELIEWLNKNHFDYRGLIEKGLAIDCTNLNIY